MTMRKLAAFVLLCITPFYSKAAVNVVFHDGIEFSEAIKNGDSQTIQQFLQSNPDIGLLPVFKSGLYRISGNLTQSTATYPAQYRRNLLARCFAAYSWRGTT
jgi:hypothetical protein